MAEEVRFELTGPVKGRRFSRLTWVLYPIVLVEQNYLFSKSV